MDKNIRNAVIAAIAVLALIVVYNLLFIRTVNYSVGGIKIPSKYSLITKKIAPIKNYKGKEPTRTIEDKKANNIGLDSTEVVTAQVRWSVFEEWVKARPEYKGWDSNPDLFKKAQDDFLAYMAKSGRRVVIIK